MKKLITLFIALNLLFASCGEATETVTSEAENKENQKTEQVETVQTEDIGEAETENEDMINMEEQDVDPHLFDNLCNEETVSDCYIVDHFKYMNATYITVDFVNYKVIETADGVETEMVNVIKTLRTMLVENEYDDCSGEHSESTVEMLATAKENPFTLFRLESNEGIVSVLFEKRCGE